MRKWTKMLMLLVGTILLAAAGCNKDADNPISPSADVTKNSPESDEAADAMNLTNFSMGVEFDYCRSDGCLRYDGKDPFADGCGAGRFLGETPIKNQANMTVGYVQIYYSDSCGYNYARVRRTVGELYRTMRVWVERRSKYTQILNGKVKPFSTGGYSSIYSDMLYAPIDQAKACAGIDYGVYYSENCTGWF